MLCGDKTGGGLPCDSPTIRQRCLTMGEETCQRHLETKQLVGSVD
jgi:hypothetical protein